MPAVTSWRGRLAAILGSLLVVLPAVGPSVPANGAEPDRDERIEELAEAIGEASTEEAAALRELGEIRAQRRELDAAVGALDAQIGDVESRISFLQGAVDQLTARALDLDSRAAKTARKLRRAQDRADSAAAQLYRNGGSLPVLEKIAAGDDIFESRVGSQYLGEIAEMRRDEVTTLGDLKVELEDLEARAAEQRESAEAAKTEANSERDELSGLRSEQAAKRDEIKASEDKDAKLVAKIRAKKDEYTEQLAALQVTSNAITTMLADRQAGQRKADNFSVVRPVPGAVTGSFGPRVHPIYGDTRFHNGVDMHADYGESIKAGADGVVVWAGWRSGYGNTVIIDHGNQYATLYAHASALHTSQGDHVEAGERIASVGATGLATGPHLHFEVRVLGIPVNPVRYM